MITEITLIAGFIIFLCIINSYAKNKRLKREKKEDSKGTFTIHDFKLIIDGKEVEAEELVITENNTWKGDVPKLEVIVDIKLKNK